MELPCSTNHLIPITALRRSGGASFIGRGKWERHLHLGTQKLASSRMAAAASAPLLVQPKCCDACTYSERCLQWTACRSTLSHAMVPSACLFTRKNINLHQEHCAWSIHAPTSCRTLQKFSQMPPSPPFFSHAYLLLTQNLTWTCLRQELALTEYLHEDVGMGASDPDTCSQQGR